MDKKEFLKFYKENSERFIPGIFNYCDRWCERCTMVEKCSLYAAEKKSRPGPSEKHSIENKEVWDHLGNMMAIASELIRDFAEENGIDLDAETLEETMEEWGKNKKEADEHPLSELSMQYVVKSKTWFENSAVSIEALANELNQKALLEIGMDETRDQANEIKDYLEVIQWYRLQIHIKLKRALLPDIYNEEHKDLIQNDQNGSAKVALLGTERSISSWYGLLKYLPEHEDEILDILVLLEKTRKGIEKSYPYVRRFTRPGFDE